jgi:protein SCO1
MRRNPPFALLLLLAAVAAARPLGAQPAPGAPSAAHSYFTDVVLLDQDGHEQRLYTDLLQGKVVVIDAMFTECTGSCPVMAATLRKVQDWLGPRLGAEAHILSFSVDPEHDTPARLKEYAARFGARPGWYFLTGSKENLGLALKKLGQWVENRDAHNTLLILGNERTGLWKKAFGLAAPDDLLKVVASVLDDKG